MAVDRVLVEIVTAANMTGINEAKAGFLGMSSALTAVTAGIGILAVAGKSAIDITEQRDKAEADLAQAILATGQNQDEANHFLQQFIDMNRAYFSSQSVIVDGYARLIRSGLSATEAQKDENRALDIAAITGRDYGDVIQQLILAEHGRLKGLSDLGVTTTKFTDAQGNMVASSHDVAKALAEVDVKTAHGRDTLTQTAQATNKLSNDWEDIANIAGPPLLGLLDGIAKGADWALHELKALGEDKTWNTKVADALGIWQNLVVSIYNYIRSIIDGFKELGKLAGSVQAGNVSGNGTGQRRAAGGPVDPGGAYIVGEDGPEMLLMGSQGGNVIPNGRMPAISGGGGSYHVHVHVDRGAFIDGPSIDRLANLILLRARHAPGR